MQYIILVLVITCFIIFLLISNYKLSRNISNNNTTSIINSTLQEMFKLTLNSMSTQEKLNKLNLIFRNTFSAKYSSIVLYDGKNYEVKSSNIEKSFGNAICDIAEDFIFKSNIENNTSKYVVSKQSNDISYKTSIERKIKSVIFTPIYYNKIYLGFWLIEDTKENAFDNISFDEIKILKDNVNLFINNIFMQDTFETAQNTDVQTGFYNNMYLYSNVRNNLLNFNESTISILCLKNIPDINEKYGRNIGNNLILRIVNIIKDVLPEDAVVIRYTGIRIIIVTFGSNAQNVHKFLEIILSKIKKEVEYIENDEVSVNSQILMHTIKGQNNVEKEVQKMLSYLDRMKTENTIKII